MLENEKTLVNETIQVLENAQSGTIMGTLADGYLERLDSCKEILDTDALTFNKSDPNFAKAIRLNLKLNIEKIHQIILAANNHHIPENIIDLLEDTIAKVELTLKDACSYDDCDVASKDDSKKPKKPKKP